MQHIAGISGMLGIAIVILILVSHFPIILTVKTYLIMTLFIVEVVVGVALDMVTA
jgi:hypothetical protein